MAGEVAMFHLKHLVAAGVIGLATLAKAFAAPAGDLPIPPKPLLYTAVCGYGRTDARGKELQDECHQSAYRDFQRQQAADIQASRACRLKPVITQWDWPETREAKEACIAKLGPGPFVREGTATPPRLSPFVQPLRPIPTRCRADDHSERCAEFQARWKADAERPMQEIQESIRRMEAERNTAWMVVHINDGVCQPTYEMGTKVSVTPDEIVTRLNTVTGRQWVRRNFPLGVMLWTPSNPDGEYHVLAQGMDNCQELLHNIEARQAAR